MIKIVTDTTCDLPPEWVEEYGIAMVPINIHFGEDIYREGVDIDHELLYRKIEQLGIIPTTSQPSVGQFAEVYRRLVKEEPIDAIISAHVTSKLSGTYQSAVLATEEVADEVKVYPFDSLLGSTVLGFMCVEASRMARGGSSAEQIMSRLEEIRSRANVLLVLENLEYSRKSGRVGGLKAALGSLLNVKPIVNMEDGILDVAESVRSRKKSLDRMLAIAEERVGTSTPINLGVMHARALEEGQELLSRAEQRFHCKETFVTELCASLTVVFGPGTLGMCFYAV